MAAFKPAANTLVFTRHDGSTFSFPKTKVSCVESSEGSGRRAIRVQSLAGGGGPATSHFEVEAILADVVSHPTVRFPDDHVFGHPEDASVFVSDTGDSSGGENEASSAQEESKGKIVFHRARCKPHPRVAFTIHAKLGSEFSGVHRIGVDGFYRDRGN